MASRLGPLRSFLTRCGPIMKHPLFRCCALGAMLLGLPLLGVILKGLPLGPYLEFPPQTRHVIHAPFSWSVWFGYLLLILASTAPLVVRAVRGSGKADARVLARYPFPWWGWGAVGAGLVFWILAWTRFPWFKAWQAHTFTPLWLSYIAAINAMTYRRTGTCMMRDRPRFFLALFPISSLFWWFFEYLNRFVQNWHYTGVCFDAWAYFGYATLSFSTVLPAVLGTREWILGFPFVQDRLRDFVRIRTPCRKALAGGVLLLSGFGLAGVGVWPNLLFPLLWVSPLLMMVSMQVLGGGPSILDELEAGDWRSFVASSCAALWCGWFWEMWNQYSLAKWTYSVPFVHRFLIFEMPVLGFAGYLPFGLTCAVIGDGVLRAMGRRFGKTGPTPM